MRLVRPVVLLAAVLALGVTAGSARSGTTAPTGLHAFMLRADEPLRTGFSRTPSFAWNPVPGALRYEFQLSLSTTFHDNSVVFADLRAPTPVEAPPLTLPWITGNPHSLYARVRAITSSSGATPWSQTFGFDMVPPPPPTPLSSYPGVLRWTPVDGAIGYQVWLLDTRKIESVSTNVLDEREYYTFHQGSAWSGTVHWRVRALRGDSFSQRVNGIPAVQYGAWSGMYTATNPSLATGPLKLVGTVSDAFSDGSNSSPAQGLMPAFVWTGNQSLSGDAAELYRVYVFTDSQCLNRVFTSAVVGSPAYAPRPLGPLSLPTTIAAETAARSAYLLDGSEPPGFTLDGEKVTAVESDPPATPTTAAPGSPGDTTSSTASAPSSSSPASGSLGISWKFGAPVSLWDVNWPGSGYYWTVVPVAATLPNPLSTNVAAPGAATGDTGLPVASSAGFSAGDVVSIGSGATAESATITSVADGKLTLAAKLTNGHGAGEAVNRTSGNLIYQDLELPQDACWAGRVMRFGKASQPSLTSSGDLFATGLSASGRLTSALHTTRFYGEPLVSWTAAPGADAYEVQWSKSRYPFVPQPYSSGANGYMTMSTALVLPVGPGVWWYRVRGFDYSLPTGSQQMTWSVPARLAVANPAFTILPVAKKKK